MSVPIDHSEWDFRPLIDTEVGSCFEYEFWREAAKAEPKLLAHLQRLHVSPKTPEAFDLLTGNFEPPELLALSKWLPHFPRTPFLGISIKIRRDLLSLGSSTQHLACVPIDWPITLVDRGLSADQYFASFGINWNFRDDKILEAFKHWLELQRPKNRPGRAAAPLLKVAKAALKHLGAYRLSREMPTVEAIAYTEEQTGKALFAREPSWSRAKKQAEALIRRFTDRAQKLT